MALSFSVVLKRLVPLLALAVAISGLANTAARADWYRAESERFIVFSDGTEASLRQYVQKLESYDHVLRTALGVPQNPTERKLPIYLVSSRTGLLRVNPDLGDNIVGFYTPGEEDIFAIAIRDADDATLLHEYAHHFMFQNAAYAYPGWFVEGFAEYYMTAEVKSDRILVGQANENRAYWLQNASWIPIRNLLSQRPGETTRNNQTYYPLAWLLTHWFWGSPERSLQLDAYLKAVGAGSDPVNAMQDATGLSPDQLRRELRRYMNGRIPYKAFISDIATAQITVARLPRSANTLLLLNQRLKTDDVSEADRPRVLAEVHALTAPWPEDTLANLTLARAELEFGDLAASEATLAKLLLREPANVEGLQLLARLKLKAAGDSDDYDRSIALTRQAREALGKAFAADDVNYHTFILMAQLRRNAVGYPNDNDMLTLEFAHRLAPQLPGPVLNLAAALIEKDRKPEALAILQPVANNPHGGGGAKAAQTMIDVIKGVSEVEQTTEDPVEATPDPAQPETAVLRPATMSSSITGR